ncbi:MAG TPA: DUF6272 family protein [Bacteroidales bacterium]|nr:DUF6272 family protein [Bacteroidales bacterium]
MTEVKTLLNYKGALNYKVLNHLLSNLNELSEKGSLDNYFYKKIQIIMIELIENNYQYLKNSKLAKDTNLFDSEFKLIQTDEGFKIFSSNPIRVCDAGFLKSHIDQINKSDPNKLRTIYKQILTDGIYSSKRTAGIGLMRIAKVAKNKIHYTFKQIDNNLLNYSIEIEISSR